MKEMSFAEGVTISMGMRSRLEKVKVCRRLVESDFVQGSVLMPLT